MTNFFSHCDNSEIMNYRGFAKYIKILAKYGMLNDDLFNLLDIYDISELECLCETNRKTDALMNVSLYINNHTEADIVINRVIKEILDHRIGKVPANSVQQNFAQRVVEDLTWCSGFISTVKNIVRP